MQPQQDHKNVIEAQICERCGAAFRCGAAAGDARCWCASMPALGRERLIDGAGCLCPACLEAQIAHEAREE
jgi:hypothetical protein